MLRILSAFAALLLVAACSTDPESSKTSKGDSQTTGQSSSSSVNTSSIAPGSMEDFVVNVGDRVFFALDSSELSSTAQDTLAKQAAWLKAYPAVNITVEGHCDERGTREYNLALGEPCQCRQELPRFAGHLGRSHRDHFLRQGKAGRPRLE